MSAVLERAPAPASAPAAEERYIGRSVPRPQARRLAEGRAVYVDDVMLPRMVHVAFLRSPHAHARILRLDVQAARAAGGVVHVATGRDLSHVAPFAGVLAHFQGMKSALQHCLPIDRVCWQGEPVVAVVADSRHAAEDALELIEVEYEELPVVQDIETALAPGTPLVHEELGDNLCFERQLDIGGFDEIAAKAHRVVERTFRFPRHTGVCLEGRSVVGDWSPAEKRLTVYISHQAPNMVQDCFARLLGLNEGAVRVICKDVGGSYGIKTHVYPDELAACALSMQLGRPVKFVADRLESFVSDIHSRDHRVRAKLAVEADGTLLGLAFEDRLAVGPYSVYPRGSAVEGNQICNITAQWYTLQAYRARIETVFTNMAPYSNYRAVGHPVAVAVTEGMVDAAARELGIDPVDIRRKNLIRDDAFPFKTVSGMRFEVMSHHRCLDEVLRLMEYERLRAEQAQLRRSGRYRGIGLASMIEITNPSAMFYGVGGVRVSAQDGCTVKMEPGGGIVVSHGCGEQGQGTETIFAQIAADALGVSMDCVRLVTGDTEVTPYGGGTWASRGAGVGGEATWLAARALRTNILELAGLITQSDPSRLDIVAGKVVDAGTGETKITLAECGRIAYFRPDTLDTYRPELCVTRHFVPKQYPFCFTNGIVACHLEVDPETGFIDLLKFWAVEDCGTVLNPQLVDEQMRGGIVHGIGPTLYEQCLYDERGQMLNANLADYLVPMAFEMPDMVIGHVQTPTRETEIGAKGAGEAGTAGAPAAIMNALNDALAPLGAVLTDMPFTPEKVLRALGRV